jgi:hypothetical protein
LYLVPQPDINVHYAALSPFLFFEKCAILINRGIVNRCMLGRFFEQLSLPTAELELAATSGAALSTSTTMKALLYRDLGNAAGRI